MFGDRQNFLARTKRLMNPAGKDRGQAGDHPEYTILPFAPQGMPPNLLSDDHRGQIFYFLPESLARLKPEASPTKAAETMAQKWIFTNDALSALLWLTVMAVQSPLETLEGDPWGPALGDKIEAVLAPHES
ncbi:LOW QUALITY PROTEIN: enoyl-hydratase isomerase family [Colletotrichum tofieldiae]|nr:LOW QUALITY PROTEIN: enoyl-hydratase isomerase family [Colletotrichum tofieldiae]GKT80603.1 LOW QUALITY PROTEIN: enoyl-hydratase isomerase family [Colletotrichum tofieldiae]GKT88731.1 LOW QUALITY PROTEIN: enoyl-hydratase isomerase family [Colletotrichum tofieldiae]